MEQVSLHSIHTHIVSSTSLYFGVNQPETEVLQPHTSAVHFLVHVHLMFHCYYKQSDTLLAKPADVNLLKLILTDEEIKVMTKP